MKNIIRVFACVLMIAMLFSALSIESYAAGGHPTEGYTRRTAAEVSGKAIDAITEIVSQSGYNGVKQIDQTYNCTAVLMEDGTVKAFFHAEAGTIKDFGQCRVSSWRNIIDIAVGPGCIYGLNESGKIIWEGLPGDINSENDYTKDAGWQIISKRSGYTEIVCLNSVLFALNSDGTIDYAFIPEYDYDSGYKHMCERIAYSTDIIDIEKTDVSTLCTLSSSGEIRVLKNSVYDGQTDSSIVRLGAVAVKLHEGSICAVMSSGRYDVIDDTFKEDPAYWNSHYLYPDFSTSAGAIRDIWRAPNTMENWLFRTEYGEMGRLWSSCYKNYISADIFGGISDWRDVNDAYVFNLTLPETFTMIDEDGNFVLHDSYWLDVVLGVKTDGSCMVDYHFTANKINGTVDA